MSLGEFKRYRSGNSWVTAAVLDEKVDVDIVGQGHTTVNRGNVLVVTSNPNRYDTHSKKTFFDVLEFEEVHVETVRDVPDPNPLRTEEDEDEDDPNPLVEEDEDTDADSDTEDADADTPPDNSLVNEDGTSVNYDYKG